METIFRGKFLVVEYDETHSILGSDWVGSESMTEEDFKREMLEYRQIAEEKKVRNYLVDNTKMYFVISPSLQIWVNETIFPYTMHQQVEKFALVLPKDFIAQVALEQTIDEGEKAIGKVQTRYFDSLDKAKEWILA